MDFTLEELSMNAWPSIQTVLLDGWIIRMANGYTKRANSINPIYSFDNNPEAKIRYCEDLYKKNNLPVIFKIVDCDEQKPIDRRLDELQYKKVDVTSVQVCTTLVKTDANRDELIIGAKFSENWKNCFYQCSKIKPDTRETIELLLKNITGDIITVYKQQQGVFAGCGYGVIENGFVGLFDIIVTEEYRGKGYGKEIVQAILSRANEAGAGKAYLPVVDSNTIAKRLYSGLGFRERYTYWYRVKEF
jgi:ribosomal protein S18 acetylase RimI-like enzyme